MWLSMLENGNSYAQVDTVSGGRTLWAPMFDNQAQVERTEDIHKSWGPMHCNGG